MESKILLEIITPQKSVAKEEIEEITLPGEIGEFGVLPGHTLLLSLLRFGEAKYTKKGKIMFFAVSKGFAEIIENRVSLFVETAEKAQDIDTKRAKEAIQRANKRLQEAEREENDFARAEAALNRAVIRIQVASRGR